MAVNHWVRGSNPRGGVYFFIHLLEDETMARICEICGKGTMSGNTVSKSMNHKRRVWKPNLIKMKTEIGGSTFSVRICARCLRRGLLDKKV